MTILSSVMAGSNIIMYAIGAATDYYYNAGGIVVQSLLVLASLTELVVSIVASVYCCYVMGEYNTTVTTVHYGSPNMFVYNQQPVAYPAAAPAPYQPVAPAPAMAAANQVGPAAPPPSYGIVTAADTDDTEKGKVDPAFPPGV
jgi:hypothetical protein